jgi:hypothetical protein
MQTSDLNQKIASLINSLATETDEARQSELFSAYLKMVGTFHNYSCHNTISIWSHCPNASRVAGYVAWKKLNRQVIAGSKGIPIFCPRFAKDRHTDESTGETREFQRIYFSIGYVFDISQTTGDALPELPNECTGDAGNLSERLTRFAESQGITVAVKSIAGSASGYATAKGKEIVLDESLSSADLAAVLIHEISHCLLHFGERKTDSKTRELEAEATAYVVASHFGLNPVSKFYLATYGVKSSDLLEALETIQQTSQTIIAGVSEDSRVIPAIAA